MPPVRTSKRPTSPVEISSSSLTYANTFTQPSPTPALQLNLYPFPRASPETDTPPKKKRSHGKARPPGHIPRPPNAFIIFRTDYIKSMATHSTPEMSKNLGATWRSMTKEEKQPWKDKAEKAKAEHQKEHPDYKYKPVHPRDAQGNCIRKPRKPNQRRPKDTTGDVLEHFPVSFPWMEGKTDGEFPNASLPSDASSASSPPRSPSPAASLYLPEPQPSYQSFRRSSSVPIPGPDDRFFFGTASVGPVYPPSPGGPHTGHVSRRLSKRPSTSMDFACPGPIHPELYSGNSEMYLSPNDSAHWRPAHRRSISAPGFGGDIPTSQFAYPPGHNFMPEPTSLTPINPVFGHVFDKFSWSTMSTSEQALADFSNDTQHPYVTLDIPIPDMTHSPTSNFSSATTPSATTPVMMPSPRFCTPAMQHPAPTSSFDVRAFQEQIREFDAATFENVLQPDGVFAHLAHDGAENSLGIVPQPYGGLPGQGYIGDEVQAQAHEEQFYPTEVAENDAGNAEPPYQADVASNMGAAAADLRGYEEGVRYAQREVVPPQALHFNELIVEGY